MELIIGFVAMIPITIGFIYLGAWIYTLLDKVMNWHDPDGWKDAERVARNTWGIDPHEGHGQSGWGE